MKRLPGFVLLLALTIGVSGKDKEEKAAAKAAKLAERAAAAGTEPAPPATASSGYEVYRNVRSKNLFDPTRRGITRVDPEAAARAAASTRTRSLALTGTMVTEGKSLAFFSGSAADGSRVVPVGNSVSNFKVASISTTQVSLEHDGKTITLDVGRALSIDPVAGDAPVSPTVVDASPEMTAETAQPALPAASGDKSDVLKRMMERRAKEMGR
jgi:hypothetical protein